MIRRTSDERVINMKVNISQTRALFPDTKRCLNPELNTEQEKTKPDHVPSHLAEKLKHGNKNLIAGESMSALDERVKNKQRWKVGLINKYENNQQMWGELTNSFVNKLKEEVNYDPSKDFKKENEIVNERLARKLEIMKQQCDAHKENMLNNPITGQRSESLSVSRRKQSQFGQEMSRSDIHSLKNFGDLPSERPSTRSNVQEGRLKESKKSDTQSIHTPGRRNRDNWADKISKIPKTNTERPISALNRSQRDQWGK